MTSKVKMFLSIEAILYVIFIWIDVFADQLSATSMLLKYIGIGLCFFYVLAWLPEKREEKDARLVRIAIGFTLLADTFLIWMGQEEFGVLSFIVVQMCYFCRLNAKHQKSIWVNFFLALALYAWYYEAMDAYPLILLIGSFYIVSLCRNVWDSFMLSKNRLFQWGLVLFLLCDCSVVLYNLRWFVNVSEAFMSYVYPVVGVLIWVFYLPSQVMLALSVEKQ